MVNDFDIISLNVNNDFANLFFDTFAFISLEFLYHLQNFDIADMSIFKAIIFFKILIRGYEFYRGVNKVIIPVMIIL